MTKRAAFLMSAIALATCCTSCNMLGSADNSLAQVETIPIDGRQRTVSSALCSLGVRHEGEVLSVLVSSNSARGAYILERDQAQLDAAVVVGGGHVNATFPHVVRKDAQLFLFLDLPIDRTADVAVQFAAPGSIQQRTQFITLVFHDGFLRDGLFDPSVDPPDAQHLLSEIEPLVQEQIETQVGDLFSNTAITFLATTDAPSANDISVIAFTPERKPAQANAHDALAVTGCMDHVLFGTILPSGQNVDPGNRDASDDALVYVGSFRGRGLCDPGLVLNSVNNVVNALALAAAHEAGHLLGLHHTAIDGLMSDAPSFAVQRQLQFVRGQVVLDVGRGPEVFTSVIQDPDLYFARLFATPP